MKSFHFIVISFVFLTSLIACHSTKGDQSEHLQRDKTIPELQQLVHFMSGEFSSFNQSKLDESYYPISLKMKPVWTSRNDGYWLYVEQAMESSLDQPYRQRIYHVTKIAENTFSSAVYELADASAAIGAYENPALLSTTTPDDLIPREGCAVLLEKSSATNYSGSTVDKSCLSQLRGATYATSRVMVTPSGISSWDQGFDDNDQQVWGATAGAYVFDRK